MAKTPKKRSSNKREPVKRAKKKSVSATPESALASTLTRFAAFDKANSANPDWKYASLYDLVASHGISCIPRKFPKGIRRGKKKQCFLNTFDLLIENPELTYVEGYITPSIGGLVLHAWAVDAQSNVLDNTLDDPESTAYFGIPFDAEFVKSIMDRTGCYGVLCQWQEVVPGFLRNGLPEGALKKDNYGPTRSDR